ncbi:cytochrome P450 [Wolfiporia cocos MD-104 SS10]|uniref:Cytochrome P450 n=1 Tax=Wolfiporia cocos (strain MD-104) TaxID=742152 RepID=A0A2H3JL82_WOLCO|nr:cytochrome P450 [Wolfiporia cocos MD-104 SS10]
MELLWDSVAGVLPAAVLISLCLLFLRLRPKRHLPPGPSPLPILGNLHQLPHEHQEEAFARWSSVYGDLINVKFLSKPALVINSMQAAQDLLVNRSGKYSERPRFVFLDEMMNWGAILATNSSNELFRKYQTWLRSTLQEKSALSRYRPLQYRATSNLLSALLNRPEAFTEHFKRFTGAILMEIAYGHTVTSAEDPLLSFAEETLDYISSYGHPGAAVVDYFPLLKYIPSWMPGMGFKRYANRVRRRVGQMLDAPFQEAADSLLSEAMGNATPSIAATLLEEAMSQGSLTPEHMTDIKGFCGMLLGAGVETTTAVLETFLLAMVMYPECFAKAQKEMDRITEAERLPTLDDKESLPYLECILKETYRWHTVVPLGKFVSTGTALLLSPSAIPHRNLVDDQYRGFDIAAGTIIIPNVWAMSQDETVYPEPQVFRPERFETPDSHKNDPRKFAYGFGRRMCPGRHLAEANVWLAMAHMIATLEITKALDATGREIELQAAFASGFTSHPKDFVCTIRPRSGAVTELVRQMGTISQM